MVHLLDLTADFVNADGTLQKNLFSPDNLHLTQEGATSSTPRSSSRCSIGSFPVDSAGILPLKEGFIADRPGFPLG